MVAGMEQNFSFLLYTIIMERQYDAYIELRVYLQHEDGLKESDRSLLTLPHLLSYIQTTFQSDLGILGWAISAEMEQIWNCSMKMGFKRMTTSFKLYLISSTIIRPSCKAIWVIWGDLCVLEWNKLQFLTIYDYNGTSRYRMHRVNG